MDMTQEDAKSGEMTLRELRQLIRQTVEDQITSVAVDMEFTEDDAMDLQAWKQL